MTESLNTATEPTRAQIRRWRRYLAEERMEARTYRALAEQRTGEERQVLLGLAEAEGRHEEYWLSLLGEHALPAPHPTPRRPCRPPATGFGRGALPRSCGHAG